MGKSGAKSGCWTYPEGHHPVAHITFLHLQNSLGMPLQPFCKAWSLVDIAYICNKQVHSLDPFSESELVLGRKVKEKLGLLLFVRSRIFVAIEREMIRFQVIDVEGSEGDRFTHLLHALVFLFW